MESTIKAFQMTEEEKEMWRHATMSVKYQGKEGKETFDKLWQENEMGGMKWDVCLLLNVNELKCPQESDIENSTIRGGRERETLQCVCVCIN